MHFIYIYFKSKEKTKVKKSFVKLYYLTKSGSLLELKFCR